MIFISEKRVFGSCFWNGSTESLEIIFFWLPNDKRSIELSWLMAVMLSFGESHLDPATQVFYFLSVNNFELKIWADLHDQTNRWLKSLCIRLRMAENYRFFLISQNRSGFVRLFFDILKSGYFSKCFFAKLSRRTCWKKSQLAPSFCAACTQKRGRLWWLNCP